MHRHESMARSWQRTRCLNQVAGRLLFWQGPANFLDTRDFAMASSPQVQKQQPLPRTHRRAYERPRVTRGKAVEVTTLGGYGGPAALKRRRLP